MSVASSLRQRQTSMEARLWSILRNRQFHGYKFRRQHPMKQWIVDFVCLERKLIVELDGEAHRLSANQDYLRDTALEQMGFLVLRIKNYEFKESKEFCLSRILIALQREIQAPSP